MSSMGKYTRKHFFEEIEKLLNDRLVEDAHPMLIYFAEDGLPELLDESGNRVVGNILGVLEAIFGYLGEGDNQNVAECVPTATNLKPME